MKFFYCFWMFVVNINCFSQKQVKQQAEAKFITRFPFKQYSGGVMIVSARFDSLEHSFNFILDTGSSGISLDSTICEEYKIIPTPTDTVIKGLGASHKAKFLFNRELHFPGLSVGNLNFHVSDYEILSSVYGEKIDGIIGYSFFSRYIIKVDFDSLNVSVFTPGELKYESGSTVLRPTFSNRLLAQDLIIRDRRKTNSKFFLDTGAGLCLLINEYFVIDSNILLEKRKPIYTQTEGIGGKLHMRITVIKKIQIGNHRFGNVPVYLYKDEYNVTSYPYVSGLIGTDLLRRFNLTINYPKGEISLVPNSHYKDPFDYAYTGISIYYIDNMIIIEDVIPGSPGEKAGIKTGDQLLGVGKNLTNDINQYKTLLQSAKEKIKVIIKRDGELLELIIRPDSIL